MKARSGLAAIGLGAAACAACFAVPVLGFLGGLGVLGLVSTPVTGVLGVAVAVAAGLAGLIVWRRSRGRRDSAMCSEPAGVTPSEPIAR